MTDDADNPWAVEVEDLRVVRRDTVILDGVTCRIARGGCTAILGPNGSGKTTFTRTLTGQMFATAGHVRVLGQSLGQCDIRALRRRVGVVHPATDHGEAHISGATVDADLSALDAVCTGYFGTVGLYDRPSAEQRERAEALLRQVGLGHRVGHRLNLLSTGEQRRALIARALAHRPELLILDEPTAGMDVAGREQVLATVERLLHTPEAPTVLFITHHVEELPPRTQQVILVRGGRIEADGPPREVITPESLTRTFGCKVFVKRLHGRYWLEVLPEAWLDLLRGETGGQP